MQTIYREILPPYFQIKFRPSNREENRLFEREYEKVLSELLPIDMIFLSCLFDDELIDTYHELFTYFNTIYKNKSTLLKNKKLKFIEVNENYFYQEYKPLEK